MRAVRILIVEDDASLAAGLAQILQGDGHAVDAMKSGEQALLAAGLEHFGLVILDIGLPGIDGFEVLRRLRSKLEPAGIRIRTVRGFGYMLEEFKGTGEPSVASQGS